MSLKLQNEILLNYYVRFNLINGDRSRYVSLTISFIYLDNISELRIAFGNE